MISMIFLPLSSARQGVESSCGDAILFRGLFGLGRGVGRARLLELEALSARGPGRQQDERGEHRERGLQTHGEFLRMGERKGQGALVKGRPTGPGNPVSGGGAASDDQRRIILARMDDTLRRDHD